MTTAAPVPPAPTCPPAYVGPCARCGHPTHKYGLGGCPLCALCHAPVIAQQARKTAGGVS
ncbi:hypothetical protein [Streptomyces bottropensis]|uniref:hypothetical protein n=1 Tax=Streptomyces bottropensis TaxID=42235 RepID=UPI003692EF60